MTRRAFALDQGMSFIAAGLFAAAVVTATLWASLGSAPTLMGGNSTSAGSFDAQAQTSSDYGRLPLAFERNTGITDRRVDFLARGPGYSLFLSSAEATLALPRGGADSGEGTALRMQLQGANPAAEALGERRLPGAVNYLRGDDRSAWETGVPTYAGVSYAGVYDGVDVRYYGNQRQLEYDFELAAGADPAQISLRFAGARDVSVATNGDLLLDLPGGTLRERAPVAYQRIGGERQPIDARYIVTGDRVSFALGSYDRSRPLTIDPLVLAYSTYLGGTGEDNASSIAVDSAGSAYVVGSTTSADFPTTSGALDTSFNGDSDAFVTKLAANGQSVAYSTYLGGTASAAEFDSASAIRIDPSGNAYVGGLTDSVDFPTTPGAVDTAFDGSTDGFVAKLTPDGDGLAYSTFLGGNCDCTEFLFDLAIDSAGSAYVVGQTGADDFPTTPGAFDTTNAGADAFVTKLAPNGGSLAYSTFLGGTNIDRAWAVAVDSAGAAHVTGWTGGAGFPSTPASYDPSFGGGQDAFVAKLTPNGASLVYSTFLGGDNDTGGFVYDEEGRDITLDSSGSAYVTGNSPADDFPTTPGAYDSTLAGGQDAFVSKVAPSGGSLAYSTFLGGVGDQDEDYGSGVAVDSTGSAYVAGATGAPDFPTTPGASQPAFAGGNRDAYVTKLAPNGQALVYSTFLGGSGAVDDARGIGLDSAGGAYVAGGTASSQFPITPGAFDATFAGSEAFVTKLVEQAATTLDAKPMLIDLGPPLGVRFGVLRAVLTEFGSGAPVAGKTIVFRSGGRELCQATTNANGVAECRLRLDRALLALLGGRYTASFAGDEEFAASSDSAGVL